MSAAISVIVSRRAHIASFVLALVGVILIIHAHQFRPYDNIQPVWDLQWLNAFSFLFLAVLAVVWSSSTSSRAKVRLSVLCLSIWSAVAVSLVVGHTPFPYNGWVGDQQIRIGMVRKFMTFFWPTDFFYKGLPPFYPPLYFWLVSLMGRVLSLEAHLAVKLGSMVIALAGPSLLYLLWRRLVTPLQAAAIVFGTFLLYPWGVLGSPHEFIAFSLFVPWWLRYVEHAGVVRFTRGFVLWGGVLGAAIFMTYYYSFFLAALVIVARLVVWMVNRKSDRHLGHGLAVLALAAMLSSVYWLPLFLSMFEHGVYSEQNRWFRIGYADMNLAFNAVSWVGFLTLGALGYLVWRRRSGISRGMLWLVGSVPVLLIVGYLLGNVDMPILYLKAREFLQQMMAAGVGLAVVAALRWGRRSARWRVVVPVLLLVLMIPLINSFTAMTGDAAGKRARQGWARLQDWRDVDGIESSVLLTDVREVGVFLPAYAFLSLGEHYSHPAGQFHPRIHFLGALAGVDDPYLVWLALRYNRFDPIDFVTPHCRDDYCEIRYILSNYPEKNMSIYLRFSRAVFDDTLYTEQVRRGLWNVRRDVTPPAEPFVIADNAAAARLHSVRRELTDEGRRLWDEHVRGERPFVWARYQADPRGHLFTRDLELVQVLTPGGMGDSLTVGFAFWVTGEIDRDYRVFFHVYDQPGESEFVNRDFTPSTPTSTWRPGEMVYCVIRIPVPKHPFRYHLGLFDGETRYGPGFRGRMQGFK